MSGVVELVGDRATRNSTLLTLLGVAFLAGLMTQPAVAATLASPTITTQATASAHTGGTISDIATLSGGSAPTGTLTFDVFDPSNDTCTGTSFFESTATVNGDGIYPSATFPAAFVGTFRWVVSYSGDANNNPVATACNDPNEITTVTLTSPTITTVATASATTPGPISDTATLAGGFGPTGTITFSLFGVDDATCTGTPLQSVKNVSDNGVFTSDPLAAAMPGTYRWIAAYSGDGNNNPVTTACNDSGEVSTVTKTSPTITTHAIVSVTMGDLISDTATLSGAYMPGGSIHFQLFAPGDLTCLAPFRDSFKSVNSNRDYTSDVVKAVLPGSYRWVATYSGDSNNNPATTACGDAGEISIVKANPTITTQATSSTVIGGAITDTANLDMGVAPTGTITFSLFGTTDCSGLALFSSPQSVTGNGSYTSGAFTPGSTGAYSWVAAYNGDANNNAATTACHDAGESSTVTKASPTISTQATASALMGTSISDTATVLAGMAPTGTITFSLFGTPGCSVPALFTSTVVVNGNAGYDSAPFFPPAPAFYNWEAAYSGDGNNNPATTACGDANETSIVSRAQPTISTLASASVAVGAGSISDSATLLGGIAPTGTITFSLFGTPSCSGTALFFSTIPVNGNGPGYNSAPFVPAVSGTYNWVASYSGDVNNNAATTFCGDPNESSVVTKARPTISTQATASTVVGGSISDSATLSGAVAPSGNITFSLFGTSTCSGSALFSSTTPVTGSGADSGPFTPTAAGTYSWVAAYSGDANNNPITSACGAANESSNVTKASPSITTQATGPTTVGGTISDTATVAGGSSPTGSVIFSLFGPNDATCSGSVQFTSTMPLSGSSSTSAAFTTVSAGAYHWLAGYGGDANNNAATGLCTDATEASVVNKATPTIRTVATSATLGGAISDSATLAGGVGPTGSITFSVFQTANCTGSALFISTTTVAGNGAYVSTAFTPTSAGTYSWVAVYSGDANNNGVSSLCGDANETSTVTSTVSSQDVALTMFSVGGLSTGQIGAYIVIVTNTGTVATSGTLTFTDTLPAGLTYAGNFTLGWNCSVAAQAITCTYAHSLPVDGITALAIFVNVTAAGGTVVTNTGTLSPLDATPADNTASLTDTVRNSRWFFGNFESRSGHNGRDDSSQSASSEGPSGRD